MNIEAHLVCEHKFVLTHLNAFELALRNKKKSELLKEQKEGKGEKGEAKRGNLPNRAHVMDSFKLLGGPHSCRTLFQEAVSD